MEAAVASVLNHIELLPYNEYTSYITDLLKSTAKTYKAKYKEIPNSLTTCTKANLNLNLLFLFISVKKTKKKIDKSISFEI